MKIGILSSVGVTLDSFFPEIIQYWEKEGNEVFTAASTAAQSGKFQKINNLSRSPRIRNIFAPREIQSWVEQNKIEILITNTATASAISRLSRLTIPVVYFCHGLHWNTGREPLGIFWRLIERLLLPRTAAVVTINSFDYSWFRSNFPETRINRPFAGVGVPLERYPWSTLPTQRSPLKLLWVGEFSDRKRPELAVEVMQKLIAQGIQAELTMLGTGPRIHQIEDLVESLGLQETVKILGSQPLYQFLPSQHILLHTAKWEGLPRVALESAAMGRLTYAFDVKGVRDIPFANLTNDKDTTELAARLSQVASSENEIPSVGEDMRNSLSSDKVADDLLIFLNNIVETN